MAWTRWQLTYRFHPDTIWQRIGNAIYLTGLLITLPAALTAYAIARMVKEGKNR